MNTVFIVDYQMCIDIQESFLKKGYKVYVNFREDFKKLKESSPDTLGLSEKYPGNFVMANDYNSVVDAVKNCDFGLYFDSYPSLVLSNIFKKYGKTLVHYSTKKNRILEYDRYFAKNIPLGFDLYSKHKISSFEEFKILGLKKNYVIKAVNEHSKHLDYNFRTIIPKSFDELTQILQTDKYNHFKAGGAVLEEYIDGDEICCGFYWDGTKIVANTVFINQEYKGVLDNNRSNIVCGECGTVIMPINVLRLSKKLSNIVKNLTAYLARNYKDYHGFIDMNMMVKNKKLYLLEFTIRAGIPTEHEIAYIVKDYPGFIRCVATGDAYKYKIDSKFYTFVCMFPYGLPYTSGRQIYIKINKKIPKGMLVNDYKYEGSDVYYREDDRPIIFVGSSQSFNKSVQNAYEVLHKNDDNNLMFRNDIGCNFIKAFKKLMSL